MNYALDTVIQYLNICEIFNQPYLRKKCSVLGKFEYCFLCHLLICFFCFPHIYLTRMISYLYSMFNTNCRDIAVCNSQSSCFMYTHTNTHTQNH